MNITEDYARRIVEKYPELLPVTKVTRIRRIFTLVPAEKLKEFVAYAKEELGFSHLTTITGLDDGSQLGAVYHLSRHEGHGCVLNVKTMVPRDEPLLPSLQEFYSYALYYEKELWDLFGIVIGGSLEGERYPLPDDWPEGHHPLRKDWDPEMLKSTNFHNK